ncbi:hypothetical protein FB451DRAFT_1032187, partial [Mycena latifolia]
MKTNAEGTKSYGPNQEDILKQLPSSLYTALNTFNIDGQTTMYAVWHLRPIKTFLSASFIDYLARTLSDPRIERMCDKACDDAWAAHGKPPPAFTTNIFQAEFMQNFEGPIPGKLFIDRGDRMRIPCALQMDFFNPEGLRKHGNHNSIGILSAANLGITDETIRYKPEYMHASIIAGPCEPDYHQINPWLKPIIDEALIAWKRGIHISS